MALTKYQYNIIGDFPNNKVDNYRLLLELESSAITETLNRIDTADGYCDIWYNNALSGSEKTILDGYVATHLGEPMPDPQPFEDGALFGDSTNLNSSAIVEMVSTTKGLLIPRMTTAQMNAISSPPEGLMLYNTDLNSVMSYDTGSWEEQRDAKKITGVDIQGTVSIDGYGLKYNSDGYFEYKPFPRVFAVADDTARLAIDAVEGDEVIVSDDGSQWLYSGSYWIKRYGYFANTLTVAQSDAQFTSIKSAIDYAVAQGASVSNTYRIDVYPGTYNEDPMTLPAGVVVNSLPQRVDTVIVNANNVSEDLFTCTGGYINGLELQGVTDSAKALVRCATPGSLVVLHGISVKKCSNGVVVSSGASCVMTNPSINIDNVGLTVTTGFTVTGTGSYLGVSGGFVNSPSALLPFYASNPIQTVFRVADSAKITINGATFSVAYKTTDADVFLCDGGSDTHIMSCEVRNSGTAAHIGAGGSNTNIQIHGGIWGNNNLNVKSDSSTGAFFINANAKEFKFETAAGSLLSGVIQLGSTATTYIAGDCKYWFVTGVFADLQDFIHNQTSTGLSCGGIVTDAGGLNVNVTDGYGWITRHTTSQHDAFDVEWDGYVPGESTLALHANTTNYIVYDSATSNLKAETSAPSDLQILLSTAITDATDIRFLHQTRTIVHDTDKLLHNYLIQTRKIALISGLAVTSGSDSYKINIDSGSWYRALDTITYDGYSDVKFSYFYGIDGYTEVADQTDFDDGYYDNSGTLTALSDGYFKIDTVFVTSDGRVSVIYGTEEYETQVMAAAAGTTNVPTFIQDTACVLANIVSKKDNGIVQIVDKRPIPNAATSSGSGGGVSAHGALSGLSNDDHTQYLLVTGSRSMSGDLSMGSNNITNVGNVDGVDVSAHASRHNPGGLDALATGIPVAVSVGASPAEGTAANYARSDHQHGITTGTPSTIGTANSTGSASTVARSDHIHAHGDQTVATLHAAATTSANGFMSSTDKTKLDSIASGATNTPLSNTAPLNVTKAAAAAGVSSEAARQDHKHDITTASAIANPPGTSNAEGTSTSLARADHTHALASFGTSAGTFCQGNDSRLSNDRTADALRTATNTVSISASAAPTTGQVLKATSATTATWQDAGAGETLAVAQARRTTSLTMSTTWQDISFDTTDVETDATVVDHEAGTPDRITVKVTGTYELVYQFEVSPTSTGTISGRIRKNDTTVIPGSTQESITYTNESDIISIVIVADLAANDYLTVQNQLSTAGTMSANATFSVKKMDGTKGDKGDPGSGSTITIQDEGTPVTGTPHSTLNFTGSGVTVTNSGGGVAQVAITSTDVQTFGVVETTGGQSITTAANVTFDGTPSPTDGSTFSWNGTDELTILRAGNVTIWARVSIQQTSGSGRTITAAEIQKKPSAGVYATLPGSNGYLYTRNSRDGDFGTIVATSAFVAAANDVIKIVASRPSGSGTVVVDNTGTNFIVQWTPA